MTRLKSVLLVVGTWWQGASARRSTSSDSQQNKSTLGTTACRFAVEEDGNVHRGGCSQCQQRLINVEGASDIFGVVIGDL
jgi:hypothetical protein